MTVLPSPVRGLLSGSLVVVNTLFWTPVLYVFAMGKLLSPSKRGRIQLSLIMAKIAESWIQWNEWNMKVTQNIRWQIHNRASLDKNKTYLICSNHQSWIDIIVLQHTFNRKVPLLRFFLKRELMYVPFLGAAWWALDFPFMKRFSKEYLLKNPEKKGQDLETTKKMCAKFNDLPVSILNFAEGTRFTKGKHLKQRSNYRNLLNPKAGGMAFVMEAIGERFDSLLDVTIYYPEGSKTLWQMLCGKLSQVVVDIRPIQIPKDFFDKNYLIDESHRQKVQEWINEIWRKKDESLSAFKNETAILTEAIS